MKLMIDNPHIPYEKLSTIKAPVLIMAGDRDVIRPEHTLKIFQHIPNSHMSILPGATHGGSWEKQELFLQLLNEFFLKPFSKPDTHAWFE
jgi:pimeloyl-ACP methyl ester carboxylesterase